MSESSKEYYLEEFHSEVRSLTSNEPEITFRGWDIYKDDGTIIWIVGRFNTLEEAQQHLDRYIND